MKNISLNITKLSLFFLLFAGTNQMTHTASLKQWGIPAALITVGVATGVACWKELQNDYEGFFSCPSLQKLRGTLQDYVSSTGAISNEPSRDDVIYYLKTKTSPTKKTTKFLEAYDKIENSSKHYGKYAGAVLALVGVGLGIKNYFFANHASV